MTTSGLCLRIARAMSRLRGSPYSTTPSPVVQELDRVDSDHAGAPPLLLLSQGPGLLWVHRVDPGLATSRQDVRHLLAHGRPSGDGAGDTVLQVVWMGLDS